MSSVWIKFVGSTITAAHPSLTPGPIGTNKGRDGVPRYADVDGRASSARGAIKRIDNVPAEVSLALAVLRANQVIFSRPFAPPYVLDWNDLVPGSIVR